MQTVRRLYNTFQPISYNLDLTLEREARTFHGTVGIKGSYDPSEPLTLHAKDLEIITAQVDGSLVDFHTDDQDFLILDSEFDHGEHHVVVEFKGTITDAMHGLYPCYFEVDGIKKELLATQFESHHAREVFPCVDEPEAKATFDLTLTTEQGVTVLSNMPIRTVLPKKDKATTVFETTPRMSSYLLAFVVGELQKKSATTTNGTEVNIYATHAQSADSLDFGLETAIKSIEFFNNYFEVPYPLPKCDHVALPDFSSGAMENWGLITYREICLLADASTAVSIKQYVATVIAHETSHQWFGNLVTMKWWDDLWLNESFATLMEYMAVDAIYPSWDIWMVFASQENISALRRDSIPGVQAVKTDVNHPDEISTLFDPSIVYAKGARLLKMLHDFIGEEAFRRGLQRYFEEHSYKNTRGSDLWSAFSDTTEYDIDAFMSAWLEQSGVPVVKVSETNSGYHLEQTRFTIGSSSGEMNQLWPIPLHSTNPDLPVLFDRKDQEISTNKTDLFYLNKGNSAYFVSAYDSQLQSSLTEAVLSGDINTVDRLALLHEASLLARAGISNAADLFRLLQAYRNEQSEPVWDIMSRVIADLKRFVEDDETMELALKSYVTSLALPPHNTLGWDKKQGESESETKLRATVIGLLSYSQHQPVIDKGLDLFRETESPENNIEGELRPIVFGIAAKNGDDKDRERLLALYKQSFVSEIQQDALSGLASTHDQAALQKLIAIITDESVVRSQDIDRWFICLISNRYSRQAAWHWLTTHWEWIKEKFDGDKSYDSFPRYAASALSTSEWRVAYDAFFAQHRNEPSLTRAIALGSEEIAGRASWIERDSKDLKSALLSTSQSQ